MRLVLEHRKISRIGENSFGEHLDGPFGNEEVVLMA